MKNPIWYPPLYSHSKYQNNLPGSSRPIPREGSFSFLHSDSSQRQIDDKCLQGGTVGWEGEDPARPISQALPSISSPTALLPRDRFSAQENRAAFFSPPPRPLFISKRCLIPQVVIEKSFSKTARQKWNQQGNLAVLNQTIPFWQRQGRHFMGERASSTAEVNSC